MRAEGLCWVAVDRGTWEEEEEEPRGLHVVTDWLGLLRVKDSSHVALYRTSILLPPADLPTEIGKKASPGDCFSSPAMACSTSRHF